MLFISSQKRKFSGTYLKPPFFSKRSKTRVCGGKLNYKQYSTLNKYHIYNNKQLYSHKHSKTTSYFHCFIVCVYLFYSICTLICCGHIMVRFLISTAFLGASAYYRATLILIWVAVMGYLLNGGSYLMHGAY